MNQPIDRERAIYFRMRKGWSQPQVAKAVGCTTQTIYRIESGKQTYVRAGMMKKLCDVFGTTAEVLGGSAELFSDDASAAPLTLPVDVPLKARVSARVHNAFTLASLWYGIPVERMVELAPVALTYLFEQSLAHRRAKVAELRALFEQERALQSSLGHLGPGVAARSVEAEEALAQEETSLISNDVFGALITHTPDDFDSAADGPFAGYLRQASAGLPCIHSVDEVDAQGAVSYEICRDQALILTGGDESLADEIIRGTVLIDDMPRSLLRDTREVERVAWLRERSAEAHARADQFFRDLGINLNDLRGAS